MKTLKRLIQLAAGLLAAPVFAATFTVTSVDDGGAGSLRQAILDANANPGADVIQFDIPGEGVRTIAPLAALPEITNTVAINGYTQPGSSANTAADGDNAVILIRLDGVQITNGLPSALYFNGAGGSSVRGLVIVRFAFGIQIYNASNVTIAGNWVGLDVDGIARGTTFDGIAVSCPVFGAAMNNVIGGLAPAERNVISGNRYGVTFSPTPAANNFVLGNFIGTDATGTLPRGNLFAGVSIQSATNITIGGAAAGARNILSACTGAGGNGVSVVGGGGHLIQGNLIGADVSGQYHLGNSSDGVFLQGASGVRVLGNQIVNNRANGVGVIGGSGHSVEGNWIGTDGAGLRPLGNALAGISSNGSSNRFGGLTFGIGNVIQFNGGAGVAIAGNGERNEISGNRIYDNGGLGIDLGTSGVTTNDVDDADTGANRLQNFPELSSAICDSVGTHVAGTLNSLPLAAFRLEFFASPAFDPNGLGEGQLLLGSTNVMTDGSGEVGFAVTLPLIAPTNHLVTATATDATGNTSEFSPAIAVATSASRVALLIAPAPGGGSTITWPDAAGQFELETTDSLTPTSQWFTVTSGVVDLGALKSFSIADFGNSNQFFRLKKL